MSLFLPPLVGTLPIRRHGKAAKISTHANTRGDVEAKNESGAHILEKNAKMEFMGGGGRGRGDIERGKESG